MPKCALELGAIRCHSVCSIFTESLAPNRDLLNPINSTTLSSITAQFINLSPWLFWLPVVKHPSLSIALLHQDTAVLISSLY